jgi:uncharacterized protein
MSDKDANSKELFKISVTEKVSSFQEILLNKKIIIGFTGGLGSTVLMKMAQKVCSEIVCIFIETKYTSPSDLKAVENVKYSEESKPPIKILEYPDLCKNILILNSKDRDFFCKKGITDILEEQRVELGFDLVLDGINYEHFVSYFDKKNQFGENYMMIFGDLEVSSEELKIIAKNNNLITFKRNPEINLLSRFPFYNFPITTELLESVARSEKFVKDLLKNEKAISRIRVIRNDQAIVEVERKNLPKILDVKSRKLILERLESLGFESVSINLSGYLRNF